MMNPQKIISLVVIFVIILGLLFVFSRFLKTDNQSEEIDIPEEDVMVGTLPVKHQYKDGEHVFVGNIELPTPCHSFNAEILTNENQNPVISVTITEPEPEVICAQVITERTFMVSLAGPADLVFDATVNGEPYELNIFEIGPDEDIESFEIFIKG